MEYANKKTDLPDSPHVAPPNADGASPFLKWAGGKRRLAPKLIEFISPSFGAYHEVCLGGGALFFELHNRGLLAGRRVFLSDANAELVNTFVVVRDRVDDLIALLAVLRALPHDAPTYYRIRDQDPSTLTDVERAARTIFVNKTGFNGVYRVNRQGEFNVPFGRHKTVSIPAPDLLRADSRALEGTSIMCTDFRVALNNVKAGDFVYIDSPYPGCFDQYTAAGFKARDHEELAAEFERLASSGAFVMASNADTDWVRQRYSRFHRFEVAVLRSINSVGSKRGPVRELIIMSWLDAGAEFTSPSAPSSAEVHS